MINLNIGRKWTIIIAVILGALAVVLTNVYFGQREARFRVEEKPVLVAAKDITRGAVIDYDMLAFKSVPVKFIQPGALRSRELAVGKTAIVTIMASEQVLSTKLAQPGTGLTLAGKTPPGKRAITIGFDNVAAVAGMIRPGDHVDVMATFASPAVTLTLFQDILVLAVGQQLVPTEEEGGRRGARVTRTTAKETLTLALTAQEAQILDVAMERGKIRLTLRPRLETEKTLAVVDLSSLPIAVDFNTLLQFYLGRTKPTKKVEVPKVEIIRGLKKEQTPIP